MAKDPFDDLLGLEDEFYKEGYEAGVADSSYAGLIEGKVFGIEKGYAKALELGRLHGRTLAWQKRLEAGRQQKAEAEKGKVVNGDSRIADHTESGLSLPSLPDNARLRKHVEFLVAITNPKDVPKDNSDEAVADVDDRLAKSKSRVKMISSLVDEPMHQDSSSTAGIEDATGLSARH